MSPKIAIPLEADRDQFKLIEITTAIYCSNCYPLCDRAKTGLLLSLRHDYHSDVVRIRWKAHFPKWSDLYFSLFYSWVRKKNLFGIFSCFIHQFSFKLHLVKRSHKTNCAIKPKLQCTILNKTRVIWIFE